MLVLVFISCRLDYSNSLFNGISDGLMTWLQSVQNAAAGLVSGDRQYDHIMRVIRQLHWLPVRKFVDFKIATWVYRSLSCMAPADCQCQLSSEEGRRQLRSTYSRTCIVGGPTATLGTDVSRLPAGPRLWNSLPAGLREMDIGYEQFKRLLKTSLFGC